MSKQHSSGYLNLKLPPPDPKKAALFGPRELKTPGSEEWIIQTLFHANRVWHSLTYDTKQWQDVVADLDQQKVWLKYPKEKPYGTRAALYMEELGADEPALTQAKEEQQLRAAQTMAAAMPVAQHGGAREDAGRKSKTEPKALNQVDNIKLIKTPGGTSKDYLAAKIKRDRPDIAADVEAGKYPSIRAAALAAGIIKYRAVQINPDDPDQIMRQLEKHCSASVIEKLQALLNRR
jgi:hypothetical protein